MIEVGLIGLAVIAVLIWALRPRTEEPPPPATLEGGGGSPMMRSRDRQ